jgi:hypothetical protein
MISELRHEFEIYDQNRRALLDDLQDLSTEQHTQRPDPDNWSILQIVQHMVLSEREVMQYLPKPEQLVDRKRGLRARLFYPFVFLILRWGIRVPVPSKGMVPDGNTTLSDLRQQWDEHMVWLRDYLNTLRPEDLNRAVFSHPIAGPLTPPQAAKMARLHFDAHFQQVKKVKASIVAPSAN